MAKQADVFLTPVEYIKGVGPAKAALLKSELGIFTLADLINLFPFRYIDRTKFYTVYEALNLDIDVQVTGKILNIREHSKNGRVNRLTAELHDETGAVELVWFRSTQWIKKSLQEGKRYVAFGRPTNFNGSINIAHPEIDLLEKYTQQHNKALQAVYPSTEKLGKSISQKTIRGIISEALELIKGKIQEDLPQNILGKYHFISREQSICSIHIPESNELLLKARQRLKFEELFFLQLAMLERKLVRETKLSGYVFDTVGKKFNEFYETRLGFELTGAQKKVIKEIRKDFSSGRQMNRLLQGDVGSGKTIVALMTMLIALDSGYQSCIMAPTEILAGQHYTNITEALGDMDVTVELLTGSVKGKKRLQILEALENGEIDILIGTHALIEPSVRFSNLAFAVVDEQHRFGVEQRSRLWSKSKKAPHILVMTATPIPRTLAMTLYGDLDISVIDQLPPGRKAIQTMHRYESARSLIYEFIRMQVKSGRQVYIVYPLIEESEKADYKNLTDGFETLGGVFPEYRLVMVHGKMKPQEKDEAFAAFVNRQAQIMVATTVIEVGVNVPNASVMVIENAERFGLSQLHQLRGRVGRGAQQSYCILLSGNKLGEDSRKRIETMVSTNDGFEISEVDLRLRGYGDILGLRQSGDMSFQIADIVKDSQMLNLARNDAKDLLGDDPALEKAENQKTGETLKQSMGGRSIWGYVS